MESRKTKESADIVEITSYEELIDTIMNAWNNGDTPFRGYIANEYGIIFDRKWYFIIDGEVI